MVHDQEIKTPAIVGIVPRKQVWEKISEERWYHIPTISAPRNVHLCQFIAFYFPSIFSRDLRYKVIYYSRVLEIEKVKRSVLFPEETDHKNAQREYYKFHLGDILELPKPIPSKKWRFIVHIPTSLERLFNAEEINDLYDTSPLEDIIYSRLRKRNIKPERQIYVNTGDEIYCLDFGIFCQKGNIDIECDGESYHSLPASLAKDRKRNNKLTSYGWSVLRFSTKEIKGDVDKCMEIIARTIDYLGGTK